jgi:hypothetical protein
MAMNTARQPPELHSVDPLQRMETEPPPAFLLRSVQTGEQPTAKTSKRRGASDATLWIALGIAALLAIGAGGYWFMGPGQKQASVRPKPPPVTMPAPGPNLVTPPLAQGLPPATNQPPPEATKPPVAAPPPAASDPSPTVASVPPATEPAPPAAPVPEAAPAPATEKPAAGPPGGDVFVVRFDNKLPGLTPTGLRALNAALRAAHGGHKVQIAIDGCRSGDTAPTGVDCAELTRRLKWILTDRGVHHPADLIADSTTP